MRHVTLMTAVVLALGSLHTTHAMDGPILTPVWETEVDGLTIAARVAFSEDGSMLAAGGDPVRVWDLSTHKLLASWDLRWHAVGTLAFTPKSDRLLVGEWTYGHGLLRMVDPRTGAVHWDTAARGASFEDMIGQAAISPDGKFIAREGFLTQASNEPTGEPVPVRVGAKLGESSVQLLNVSDGRGVREVLADNATAVAFAPDGKTLAIGHSTGGKVTLITLDGGATKMLKAPKDTDPSDSGFVMALTFTPDSKHLAVGTNYNAIRLWDLAASEVRSVMRTTVRHEQIAISPSGHWLAAGSSIFDLRTGKQRYTIPGLESFDRGGVAFSRDGRWLATASRRGDEKPGLIVLWRVRLE